MIRTRRVLDRRVRPITLTLYSLFLFTGASRANAAPLLIENFDNVGGLAGSGWVLINKSNPVGTGWFQGNPGVFPSQAGSPVSYVAANFLNATAGGDISNWLLTPVLSLVDDVEFSFYTRTELGSSFPDRLEVRLSASGASTDVGATSASVGDFSTLLLSINPTLSVGGYPSAWTLFTLSVSGLGAPASGRFAFRYTVPNTTINADYIGIDTVTVKTVPEPGTMLMTLTGVAALARRVTRTEKVRHGRGTRHVVRRLL